MSAVSMPTPTMLASRRTIACGPASGACTRRSCLARSIAVIWSRITASRVKSRWNSSRVLGGMGTPSGVRKALIFCGALRNSGLKPRIPSRARAPFIRLMMRVRSPTRLSRSRLGRLASSSSIVGTATILQWPGSPRSQPRNTRSSNAVSSRSVFARLCSRETATLVGWMTWASTPCKRSQRASQKPSRPASKAIATRLIVRPDFVASAFQRSNRRSNPDTSGAIFFNGCRSIPGTMAATSQLDRLNSMTAMSVPSCSKAVTDRLRQRATISASGETVRRD